MTRLAYQGRSYSLEQILSLANNKKGDSTREFFKFEGSFIEIDNEDGTKEIMVINQMIGDIESCIKLLTRFDMPKYNSQHVQNSKAILKA